MSGGGAGRGKIKKGRRKDCARVEGSV